MLIKPLEMLAKEFHKIYNTPGPSKCLVHWNDETRKSLDDGDYEKWIGVLVSGVQETKLLRGPIIRTKLKGKYG